MPGDSLAQIIYLVLLGTAVVGWFIASNRNSLGKTAQHATIWGLIFIGVVAAVGLWGDIRDDILPQQSYINEGATIEVPRSPDGHFYLTLQIKGQPVRFTVDTGATYIVLSPDDARRIGINPETLAYLGQAETANGTVRTARVKLDNVLLGPIIEDNIPAYVNEADMDSSLLGMSYLNRFERIEIANGKLVLTR
ncbi:TIGR02281 family clan AA aspartic protease [Pseudohalocynthiibacter aestuariivivens]|jgi:aspartyl protease family protein|uniref:TIGR02281 family clan AA aspartic protease n=1 Tax=Pseudohalocynthiibacter aestuariivivens TaxID=1591409 RepID=A0ABV5JJI7_9RHOB|nr:MULTISPECIES: TIGR02281 family clan AA aspartic protease [Pseudohalocynthiibacter]MBS9716530.1 TIGR02281 family clan AA aspartic protease [Pseudohalocynthiibacter aestuariivivens]MCK0101599.1 TIGR02281 family clan AA aspartic protease [Pseudohalocynthiibacter sp. F2068]